MPTYEYACRACAERLEVVQSFADDPLTECPACGGTLRKVFQPVGIAFKGSGFYKTDSRSTGTKSTTADGAKTDTKTDATKGESSSTSSTPAKSDSSTSSTSPSSSSSSSTSSSTSTSTSSTPAAAS